MFYHTQLIGAYTNNHLPVEDQESWLDNLFAGTPNPISSEQTTENFTRLRFHTEQKSASCWLTQNQNTVKQRIVRIAAEVTDRSYATFYIPKATGGLRRIDAPNEELKTTMRQVKKEIETALNIHPHDAAHAYVKNRSVLTALQVHQRNQSNWFLKLDLKDFFPSHTPEYVAKQLHQLYLSPALPIPELLELSVFNGGLPQGTPLSPLLTNLCMTPIDYAITKNLSSAYRYTRYADDLLISSRASFSPSNITDMIKQILQAEACPFTINEAKTRYGSAAGRNWNLGLMYNKDNNITLGHQKKQRLRAMINNFLRDFTNGILWTTIDVQHLQGTLAYFKHIEPEYALYVFNEYSTKYNCELKHAIKTCLNN